MTQYMHVEGTDPASLKQTTYSSDPPPQFEHRGLFQGTLHMRKQVLFAEPHALQDSIVGDHVWRHLQKTLGSKM